MRTEIRCKVELREDDTLASPGRLTGTLLTYGERANDRPELFERGAFDLDAIRASGGIVLNRQHTRGAPIVRVVPELQGDKLVIDTALPDTQAGRDAAVEIRSGLMRGLSIEFKAIRASVVSGVRRISKAALVAGGLVDDASYLGSTVEVREGGAGEPDTWLRPWG